MKKRISAAVVALVLCLSLLGSMRSAYATETPHFLAVNDSLLQLENRYIPILADGLYYVPYPALDVASTGVNLGIYPVYNSAIRTLTIYNREKVIAFDLTTGTCTDRNGVVYSCRVVTRNGQIYVPARFICDFFGLTYSYFPQTKFGPMIRICGDKAKLNDRYFVSAAQLQMEERLRDWRKNQAPAPTSTPTPTPTPTPVKPTPTPTPSAKPTQSAEPSPTPSDPKVDRSDVRTYLAFRADQTEGLNVLLNRLEGYRIKAVFFFPADDLAQYDAQIRRVLISGHAVGLTLSGTTAQELKDSAKEGNRILRQIAYTDTHTVLLPEGTGRKIAAELRQDGLLIWQTDVDATSNGESIGSRAEEIRNKVKTMDSAVYLLSDCKTSGAALMVRLIPELMNEQYDFRLAVETEL